MFVQLIRRTDLLARDANGTDPFTCREEFFIIFQKLYPFLEKINIWSTSYYPFLVNKRCESGRRVACRVPPKMFCEGLRVPQIENPW